MCVKGGEEGGRGGYEGRKVHEGKWGGGGDECQKGGVWAIGWPGVGKGEWGGGGTRLAGTFCGSSTRLMAAFACLLACLPVLTH